MTTKDFLNKLNIARKEARESRYWIKLISSVYQNKDDSCEIDWLERESNEIVLILSAIIKKTVEKNSRKLNI